MLEMKRDGGKECEEMLHAMVVSIVSVFVAIYHENNPSSSSSSNKESRALEAGFFFGAGFFELQRVIKSYTRTFNVQ